MKSELEPNIRVSHGYKVYRLAGREPIVSLWSCRGKSTTVLPSTAPDMHGDSLTRSVPEAKHVHGKQAADSSLSGCETLTAQRRTRRPVNFLLCYTCISARSELHLRTAA